MIKDSVANSFHVDVDDSNGYPFHNHGRLSKSGNIREESAEIMDIIKRLAA
jgi:hypothetical protein